MASNNLPLARRKAQPQQLNRLLELAEKRGYSARALTALALAAVVAHSSRRSRKAVRRG